MARGFGIGWNDYEPGALVFYWWFVGWDCLSIGLHVCTSAPNIEIHLPFGFVRIGRRSKPTQPLIITHIERRKGVRS